MVEPCPLFWVRYQVSPLAHFGQASKLGDATNIIGTPIKVWVADFLTSLWRKIAYSIDTFRSRLEGYDHN
jgi:hypothetical protein